MKKIALIFAALFVILFGVAQNRPNIILIMSDDQGWFDAGFNGNLSVKTPNLDKLAGQGVVFDRFYSAAPVCSPTRASVITGRNPFRIGIPTANAGHMRNGEITLPELLKNEGYATGHFGKWHLGILTRNEPDANRGGKEKFSEHFSIPTMHGYDEFFCTESKVPTYDPLLKPVEFKNDESLHFGWTAIQSGEESAPYGTAYWTGNEKKAGGDLSGDDTKLIIDHAIPFIQKSVNAKRPFFTTIWTHAPHLPVVAAQKYKKMYAGFTNQQQLYYGCITALDEQVGRLWNELENLGVADNTIVFYCSDNGPENRTPGSAGIFRERKRSLYEGGLRTPAFVVWKGNLPAGKRVEFPAVTSDYLPTIVNLLGIHYPDDRPLDGTDLMPLIQHPDKVREKPIGFRYPKKMSWMTHEYKLISKDDGQNFELYDLLNDPSETTDIIRQKPDLAKKMKQELNAWLKSVENSNAGKDY